MSITEIGRIREHPIELAMIYSQKKSFCFLALPKTGSSSISKHLLAEQTARRNEVPSIAGPRSVGEHASAREIIKIVGEDAWAELYTFGFVRNPFCRAVSAYHFYRSGRAASWERRIRNPSVTATANVILTKLLPFHLWVRFFRAAQYTDYLTNSEGELAVTEVFRFEEIETAFARLTKQLGLKEEKLTKQNTTNHGSYTTYYERKAREQIEKNFAKDLSLFGYRFGD